MRIGIDIRTVDPIEPGQQRMLWRFGRWLAGRGHPVELLTLRSQRTDVTLPEGVTLHRLHALGRSALHRYVTALDLDVLLLNPERARRYRGLSANVLRSGYGTEHYAQKLRSFRGPLERGLRWLLRANPWDAAERTWERAFYEDAEPTPEIIAQSAYMKGQILASYDVAPERVHVVHNGIDTDEYSVETRTAERTRMRDRWAIPDDALCLLVLAHNFRLKGVWDILDVVAHRIDDPRVHVLVAGRGTGAAQRASARRRIERLGLADRVTLAGAVRPALHALAAADVLLHLSWHDSFGFVVLEAMACGLPVITTPRVGASELIDDGVSGLLVDPGSHAAIAAAIDRLRDPDTRAALGAEAARVGRAHNEPTCFGAMEEVLRIAAGRRARARGGIVNAPPTDHQRRPT